MTSEGSGRSWQTRTLHRCLRLWKDLNCSGASVVLIDLLAPHAGQFGFSDKGTHGSGRTTFSSIALARAASASVIRLSIVT